MASIFLITAAGLFLFLAARGFRQQPEITALASVKCLAKKPMPTIGRDTDESNHE